MCQRCKSLRIAELGHGDDVPGKLGMYNRMTWGGEWVRGLLFRCVLASLYEGLSVRPSVGPSVRPSVRPSVGHAFVENGKIDDFDRT